jgi:hypothetical protein
VVVVVGLQANLRGSENSLDYNRKKVGGQRRFGRIRVERYRPAQK